MEGVPSNHKVLTYVEHRAVPGVFQNIDPPPPSPPCECVLPRTKGGGYTLAGLWGNGGSIFRKMPAIGLASYSLISLRIKLWRAPPQGPPPSQHAVYELAYTRGRVCWPSIQLTPIQLTVHVPPIYSTVLVWNKLQSVHCSVPDYISLFRSFHKIVKQLLYRKSAGLFWVLLPTEPIRPRLTFLASRWPAISSPTSPRPLRLTRPRSTCPRSRWVTSFSPSGRRGETPRLAPRAPWG